MHSSLSPARLPTHMIELAALALQRQDMRGRGNRDKCSDSAIAWRGPPSWRNVSSRLALDSSHLQASL